MTTHNKIKQFLLNVGFLQDEDDDEGYEFFSTTHFVRLDDTNTIEFMTHDGNNFMVFDDLISFKNYLIEQGIVATSHEPQKHI